MKSDPTPLQLTKICLKQLGQVCLSTLFLLYNSTLLIYVINQRHTHTETTLSDWMKAAHYWIHNYLHPRYVYSILFYSIPACCAVTLAFRLDSVMISLPPLPDRPLLWGKGCFSSSQPRALQRSWQACLSTVCGCVCVCACVCAGMCIILHDMGIFW